MPDFIPPDAWEGFKAMRKALKKPLTEYAEKLAISKLEAFHNQGQDVAAVLNQSTMNSWLGLFEVRDERRSVSRQAPASQKFNFANVDRAGDAAAQAASMLKHRITATDSEVEF